MPKAAKYEEISFCANYEEGLQLGKHSLQECANLVMQRDYEFFIHGKAKLASKSKCIIVNEARDGKCEKKGSGGFLKKLKSKFSDLVSDYKMYKVSYREMLV